MGKLTAVVVLAVLVTAGLPAHAAVSLTFSPSTVTAAQVNAGVSINIVLTGSTSTCSQVTFHLIYDKTKVAVSSEAVVTGLSLLTPTSDTDGEHFGGFTLTPITLTNPTTVGSFTLTTIAGQDPTGSAVSFNTADTINPTQILNGATDPITLDSLGTIAITAGPPNPARTPVLAITPLPPTKLKDSVTPFNVSVTWTTGVGKDIQIQYNTGAGFPTNGATQGTITGLSAPGTSPLTCHWASGLTVDQAISVRCRILDQGNVWNGTAAVDAAANPTVGWTSGTTVNVDNVPPTLSSATATDGADDVFVTFGEPVTQASSELVAHYTINQTAGPGSPQVIGITSASNATSSAAVHIVTSSALHIGSTYTLTATGISDIAGNVSGTLGPATITFKPVLQSASLVLNTARNQVNAVFSNAMTASTVNTASAWSVTGGTGTRTVTTAALQGDGKTVLLTLSAALAMNVTYTVTCPATAADATTAVTVGADNHVTFTTPFWHDFVAGFFTVGIPLDVDGRVITLLSATKVASFDPTLLSGAGGYLVDPSNDVEQVYGKGYFARWAAATTAFIPGAAITSGNTTLTAVPAGFNLITDPYLTSAGVDVPIQINWITSGANALQYAWYWDGTQYQLIANLGAPASGVHVTASPIMHAWTGYFINQPATGDIVIHQTAPAGVDVKPLQVGDKSSVLIQLVARAGNSVDSTNVCGVAASAVKIANPPYAAGSVDLAILDEDGNPQAFDVTTGSVARKFNLLVTTDQANAEVTVSAPDLSAVPKEYTVILSDPETGKKCALRTSAGFTFTAGAAGASKRLVLEIAPRSTATLVTGVSVAQAGAGHVVVTYQLSGAAAVSASVMNIAGRVVRTLVASSTETAGTHTLAWDLANGAGAAVPRGTYLLRLQARTEDGQQIESVRTFAVNR